MRENLVQCPYCLTDNAEDSQVCSNCGSSLDDSIDTFTSPVLKRITPEGFIYFAPGEVFADRYQIIEEIGRGGMGIVYKADDQHLGIKVALKLIDPFYSSSSSMIQRFKKETLLTRSISHENVIRIHDIGQQDDIVFISMDYIEGQNLRELIRVSGNLGEETAIKITQQICQALAAAHKKGIIHRDLKSQNIMVDKKGHVYTMDFGLAKTMEGSSRDINIHGLVLGTPAYMSPEQAKGEDTDHRSDIYSLGIIMFELFTGARPFSAETKEEYLRKHIQEDPPPPDKFNPLVPAHINEIILKCLEKDKSQRFQSAQDVLEAINPPLGRKEPEPRSRFEKMIRYWFVLPLVVTALVSSYFLFYDKTEGERPAFPLVEELGRKSVAILEFENNTGDEGLNYWARALQNYLIVDLGQSKYFRILADDRLDQVLEPHDEAETTLYSSDVLDRIAVEENVRYFLLGSYAKAGEDFWITVKIKEAGKSEFMGSVRADSTILGGFLPMVDDLTQQLKVQFKLTSDEIAADIDMDVNVISTSFPFALDFFNQGKRLIHERKYEESVEYFEKALEIDPEFAMAHKLMADAYRQARNTDKWREHFLKAVELSHRVSERDRYLIQASASLHLHNSIPQAIDDYKELLKIYPDDEEGNKYLGGLYRYIEEWDLALGCFKTLLKSPSQLDRAIAADNVSMIYMANGGYDQALEIMTVNESIFSNQAFFHRYLSNIYLCQNEYDLAVSEAREALELEPDYYVNHRVLGQAFLGKGDFDKAIKTFSEMASKDDFRSKADGVYWLVYVYLTQGKYDRCIQQIKDGLQISQEPALAMRRANYYLMLTHINLRLKRFSQAWEASNLSYESILQTGSVPAQKMALLVRGITQVETERMDDAKNTKDQLRKLIEEAGVNKHLRYFHHLNGYILREEGKLRQAEKEFEKAVSYMYKQRHPSDNQALFYEGLARMYFSLNDFENAADVFTQLSSLSAGRMTWGDSYVLAFYWLGKIYQEEKQIDKAKDSYLHFLKLWEHADPGLEWILDAKKQLTSLE